MPPGHSFALLQQLAEQRRDNGTRKLGAALARFREANDRLQLLHRLPQRLPGASRSATPATASRARACATTSRSSPTSSGRSSSSRARWRISPTKCERLRAEIAHEQRQVESFTVLLRAPRAGREPAREPTGRSRCRTSSPPIPSCASPAGRGATTDAHGVADDPQHRRCDGAPAVFRRDRRTARRARPTPSPRRRATRTRRVSRRHCRPPASAASPAARRTEPDSANPTPPADAASPMLPLAEWVIPWIVPITPVSASPGGRAVARCRTGHSRWRRPRSRTTRQLSRHVPIRAGDALRQPSRPPLRPTRCRPRRRRRMESAEPRPQPGFGRDIGVRGQPDRAGEPRRPRAAGCAPRRPLPAAAVAQAAAPSGVAVTAPAADDAAAGPPSSSPAPRARAEVPEAPLRCNRGGRRQAYRPTAATATRRRGAQGTRTAGCRPARRGRSRPPVRERDRSRTLAVATAVGTPGWHEDVAQKFAHVVSLRLGEAEIRLNPAHLGPVGIEISYGDNQASVLITAAQPATRDALEQALPHLRELLAQQGIALGESTVRDQPGGEGAAGAANALAPRRDRPWRRRSAGHLPADARRPSRTPPVGNHRHRSPDPAVDGELAGFTPAFRLKARRAREP